MHWYAGCVKQIPGRLTSKDRAKGKDTGVLVMVSKNTSFRQNNLVCERDKEALIMFTYSVL